ncbi:MAG: S8/S53 family peptidase [Archangiaceae bacterium]|nr:S8/S53 family peptidase [Archangiaceae bacterium]
MPAALPWHLEWLGATELWRSSRGAHVRVAVLDTAVAPLPAFGARLEVYRPDGTADVAPPFPEDHGTHCAGLIASDDKRAPGIAPEATVLSFPVTAGGGVMAPAEVEEALSVGVLAASAHVVSCSFVLSQCPAGIRSAVQLLRQKGVVVIGAGGNEADTASAFPEQVQGITSVTAHRKKGGVRDDVRLGDWLDAAAPGEDLKVLRTDGGVTTWPAHTSGAAALTAGVCALLLAAADSSHQLEQLGQTLEGLIRATGDEFDPPQPFKRLDARALLKAVLALKEGL